MPPRNVQRPATAGVRAATPAGVAVLSKETAVAREHAQAALELIELNVPDAEKILRDHLGRTVADGSATRAALLNDLALCALHVGRAHDAVALLREAVAALPEGAAEGPTSVALRVRCQLMLNLCEAHAVAGQHGETLRAAGAVLKLITQQAVAGPGSLKTARSAAGSKSRLSQGATSRLFVAKWLLPAAAPPGQGCGVEGALPLAEALLLGWLWCALAQEGLGAFSESLKSYAHAMAVADIDRSAAGALAATLQKKISLGHVAVSREGEASSLWHGGPPPHYASSQNLRSAAPSLVKDGSGPASALAAHASSFSAPSFSASGAFARPSSAPHASSVRPNRIPQDSVRPKVGPKGSLGTKAAFAVYALASAQQSAQRADSALTHERRVRDDARRRATLRAEAAARAEVGARLSSSALSEARSGGTALPQPEHVRHGLELSLRRASRLGEPRGEPGGGMSEAEAAARSAARAELRERVLAGEVSGGLAAASAARRRLLGMRKALYRAVARLTALRSSRGANATLPFPRILGELEHLRELELKYGSARRARSLSTAVWLFRRCTPPAPPVRPADEGFEKAVAVLVWLLEHFDQPELDDLDDLDSLDGLDEAEEGGPNGGDAAEATSERRMDAAAALLTPLLIPASTFGDFGVASIRSLRSAPPEADSLVSRRSSVVQSPPNSRRGSPPFSRRSSVGGARRAAGSPLSVEAPLASASLDATCISPVTGSPLSRRSQAGSLDAARRTSGSLAPASLADASSFTRPAEQPRSGYFGEVYIYNGGVWGAPPSPPRATSHAQPMPAGPPVRLVAGKQHGASGDGEYCAVGARELEAERVAAAAEAAARALAQARQRERIAEAAADREAKDAARLLPDYQTSVRRVGEDARLGVDAEAVLAAEQRLWRHGEAEARRREAEAVLLREAEFRAAQRARLGLGDGAEPHPDGDVAAAASPGHHGRYALLSGAPPPALIVTHEMLGFVNDAFAAFALFHVQGDAPDPPMVLSGVLVGGGSVRAAEVELAVEAFGTHYLCGRAHEGLAQALRQRRGGAEGEVSFVEFAHALLSLMAEPDEEPTADAAPVQPEALAVLYSAFSLFDDGGSGVVRLGDVELVLQAMNFHVLESSELEQLLDGVGARLAPGDDRLPFHAFLRLLAPASRLRGRSVFNHRAPTVAAAETAASTPPLPEAELALLWSHFAAYALDDASGGSSGAVHASELPSLLRDAGAPLSAAEVGALLRSLGAHGAAAAAEGGFTSATPTPDWRFEPVGYEMTSPGHSPAGRGDAMLDFEAVRLVYALARRPRGAPAPPSPVCTTLPRLRQLFRQTVGVDGLVGLDDIELILNEVGLHYAWGEMQAALASLGLPLPRGASADFRLTLEQMESLLSAAEAARRDEPRPRREGNALLQGGAVVNEN